MALSGHFSAFEHADRVRTFSMCMVKTNTNDLASSKVRSDGLQTPKAAASQPTTTSSVCLPSFCWISLLMSALLHTVQASVCAMIFAFGREVGRYSALRLELRTVV